MSEHHGDGPAPDDPLPAMLAKVDQQVAMAPHLAKAAKGFHAAFVAEGFQPHEAVYLVAVQLMGDPGRPAK